MSGMRLLDGRSSGCVEEGSKEDGGKKMKGGSYFGYLRTCLQCNGLELSALGFVRWTSTHKLSHLACINKHMYSTTNPCLLFT